MQPFTAKMLVVSFVGLQLLLFSMRMCAADSNGLDVQICDRLHVGHGSAAHSVNERVTVLLRKTDGTQVTCVEPSQEYKGTHIKTLHDCTSATIMAFHSCTFMTSSWERELRKIHLSSTLYQYIPEGIITFQNLNIISWQWVPFVFLCSAVQLISYTRDIKGFILQADKGTFPFGETIDLPDGTNRGPCEKSVSHRYVDWTVGQDAETVISDASMYMYMYRFHAISHCTLN